jgi:hypothetical protein
MQKNRSDRKFNAIVYVVKFLQHDETVFFKQLLALTALWNGEMLAKRVIGFKKA